jgi:hypothetical protein
LGIFGLVDMSIQKREAALLLLMISDVRCLGFLKGQDIGSLYVLFILICTSVHSEFMLPNQVAVFRIVPSAFLVSLQPFGGK